MIPSKLENSQETIHYYLKEGESPESLLKTLPGEEICFYETVEQTEDYLYLKATLYKCKKIAAVTRTVEKGEQLICFQRLDLHTHRPIHTLTEKWCYDDSGNELYSFEYDEKGNAFMVFDDRGNRRDFLASRIGKDADIDFTWEGREYYRHSDPFFPVD